MQNALAAQRAKTRARQRARPQSRTNVAYLTPVEPLQLTAEYVVPETDEDEAPFLPPPANDIFGLEECEDEEDTIFVSEPPPALPQAAAAEDEDAPFDPPEFDDEPAFSPPVQLSEAPPKPEEPPKALQPLEPPRERPAPAISIHASWDRPEAEALLREFSSDARLKRAEIQLCRGGLDGAIAFCGAQTPPDLLVLDTNLQGHALLAGLDRLRALAPLMRIIILGGVNDIGLLRDLAARGVSDYIVPPASAENLTRSVCQLFADTDAARVIAVIGARGGVGSSTIARNLAWSIAERQQLRTALIDLDLSFGDVAASFSQSPDLSVLDVLNAEDPDAALTGAECAATPRLKLVTAPQTIANLELDEEGFADTLAQLRRIAPNIVLDLPHAWEPWVRRALREADDVVIVAGPDLASLRNADNMLKLLRSERDKPSAPAVVLSMVGVPKRPEIPLKDYAQALCVQPLESFAFEPELFAKAEAEGQMLYEAMPDAKAALQLDLLASALTGRDPVAKPAPRTRQAPAKPPEPLPVLELTKRAPPNRRRRAARTGFVALQEPRERKRPSGLVRTMAAALALIIAGAWFEVQQAGSEHPAPAISFRV